MLDMLAFSPHPDDVELCCGGLIAKLCAKGYRVGIVDLTKGELGTGGTGEIRMQEAAKAAKILGVEVRENMDYGDCRLNSGFDEAKRLAGIIRQHQPTVLIAPYGDEQHPDHAASRELVDKAAFFAKLPKIETGHKTHQIKMVAYYMVHKTFAPSFVVDVTKSYDKKLEAIKAYKSQMELMLGIEGLLTSIELRDQLYGLKVGVKHGEPFFCNNPLKIDEPVAFLR
ncbi:MAG: bacillithiol biosynthesis deacetylase BshB1 [Candidatus Bathyarchaeota archaeon]|nr:MAG: bacillithiol biosynthesis deacetylase BshB1 [Candidatus Bathyarchaeota archaeon]